MHTLTPRQLDILRFVRDYRARSGYSPTLQEIGDHLGINKVTVYEHVVALERKKLLLRGPRHKARSLLVATDEVFPEQQPTRIPLAGRIAAGRPLEAVEDTTETLDLQAMFSRPGRTFCLRVAGDSMIDDHIRDGDYVICEPRQEARNGETVVAVLPNGEATLKRFYRERGRIRLQPANPDFAPLYVHDVEIRGVVIGVVRRVR